MYSCQQLASRDKLLDGLPPTARAQLAGFHVRQRKQSGYYIIVIPLFTIRACLSRGIRAPPSPCRKPDSPISTELTTAPQSHHHPKPTTALAESANLSIRNPNKRIIIYFDRIDARGYYRGQRFDSVELEWFYQEHKKTNKLIVKFQGQNLVMLAENLVFLFSLNRLQLEAPIRICGYVYLGTVMLMMDGGWRLKVEVEPRRCDIDDRDRRWCFC
ncbi:hypothetical protein LguiB_020181 [Lonicera macranthoides]